MKAIVMLGFLFWCSLVVGCSAAADTEGGASDLESVEPEATGEASGTQAEALISCPQPWYRAGIYPDGQSCSYACYYYVKAGTYARCECSVREPGSVEMWVNKCP